MTKRPSKRTPKRTTGPGAGRSTKRSANDTGKAASKRPERRSSEGNPRTQRKRSAEPNTGPRGTTHGGRKQQHKKPSGGAYAVKPARNKPSRPNREPEAGIEVTVLPGLIPTARQELTHLAGVTQVRKVQGEDALIVDGTAQLDHLEATRSITAVWIRRTFTAPRPKALLGDEALRAAAADLRRVAARHAFIGLRLEAAGRDSATLKRLASAYAEAAGVTPNPADGDLVMRLRSAKRKGAWDLLIRTTPRPLSTRPWRKVDLPGSLNACVAASVWLHAGVQADERILNPACGGGTLLAERLTLGPATFAAGFDTSEEALQAARTNLAGMARGGEVHLTQGDLRAPDWGLDPDLPPFDTIVCDPPWGDAVGDKQASDLLHEALLSGAAAHLKPGGRLLLVTHAIKTTDRLLARGGYTVVSDRRVFAGGHRPRLLHLVPTR